MDFERTLTFRNKLIELLTQGRRILLTRAFYTGTSIEDDILINLCLLSFLDGLKLIDGRL